jgi:hypothetical protein
MAHFARKSCASRSPYQKYGSLTVLGFRTNCTHVQSSIVDLGSGLDLQRPNVGLDDLNFERIGETDGTN